MGVTPEIKSNCSPNHQVEYSLGKVSISEALSHLAQEREFLGEKAYKNLAGTLANIPCDPTTQTEEHKRTLSALVALAKEMEDYRKIVGPYVNPKDRLEGKSKVVGAFQSPKDGLRDKIEIERNLEDDLLKGDITTVSKNTSEPYTLAIAL